MEHNIKNVTDITYCPNYPAVSLRRKKRDPRLRGISLIETLCAQ